MILERLGLKEMLNVVRRINRPVSRFPCLLVTVTEILLILGGKILTLVYVFRHLLHYQLHFGLISVIATII